MASADSAKENLGLRKDIKLIRAALAALETRIQALETATNPTFALDFAQSQPVAQERSRGRTARMSDPELSDSRDAIYTWAGEHWPELLDGLLEARRLKRARKDARQRVVELLCAIPNAPASIASDNAPDEILNMLTDKRWNWSVRFFADALAGVPKYPWRTSWNRCSNIKGEPRIALNSRAWRSYVQRRYPGCFRRLEQATRPIEIERALASITRKDLILYSLRAMTIEQIKAVLAQGLPRVPQEQKPPRLVTREEDANRSERYREHNGFGHPGSTPHQDLNMRCDCGNCRREDGRDPTSDVRSTSAHLSG